MTGPSSAHEIALPCMADMDDRSRCDFSYGAALGMQPCRGCSRAELTLVFGFVDVTCLPNSAQNALHNRLEGVSSMSALAFSTTHTGPFGMQAMS